MSGQYSSPTVATMTGLSRRRISQWAQRAGKKKVGRDYVFSDSDIERIRAGMQTGSRDKS